MSRRIYHDPPNESSTEILKDFELFECPQVFDLEFQTQEHLSDDYAAFSLPFWMCTTSNETKRNQSYSSSSRFQEILDGRKVLMELIQNIPESSYELSLRDIITDHQSLEGDVQNEVIIEAKSSIQKPEIKLQKMKKISSRGQMERNGSLGNGVLFLLKMFIPVSFAFMVKQKTMKNWSKVLPRTSFDGFEKPVLEKKKKKKKKHKSIKRSKYRNIRFKIRLVDSNVLCCWRFFWRKNSNQGYKGNALF